MARCHTWPALLGVYELKVLGGTYGAHCQDKYVYA